MCNCVGGFLWAGRFAYTIVKYIVLREGTSREEGGRIIWVEVDEAAAAHSAAAEGQAEVLAEAVVREARRAEVEGRAVLLVAVVQQALSAAAVGTAEGLVRVSVWER